MRFVTLFTSFLMALALFVCLAAAVAGNNTNAVSGGGSPVGRDNNGGIIFEKASFMRTSEDDPGSVWLTDTEGNPLCRIGRIPALTHAPGIRRLLAVDIYYRESDAIRERLTPDALLIRARENGGFTYNPLYGATPQCGYAVSLQGREKILDAGTLTGKALLEYLRENGEETRDPARYVGGWIDGGRLYLDVSIVLPDEKEARKTGWMNDQTCIFNLGTNETIYLKGPDGNWLIDAGGDWLPGTPGSAEEPSRASPGIVSMTGTA